eukprot:jgi/Galph1/5960/GphlegSOOS_G4560.1
MSWHSVEEKKCLVPSMSQQVEESSVTLDLSREAGEAAEKAKRLRRRFQKLFLEPSVGGEEIDSKFSSDGDRTLPSSQSPPESVSDSSQERYTFSNAVRQLEDAARVLREVSSLELSTREAPELVIMEEDNRPQLERKQSLDEESSYQEYTHDLSKRSVDISEYEWEILHTFRPSRAIRERLLQFSAQTAWRQEAIELVRHSKHLTLLWNYGSE